MRALEFITGYVIYNPAIPTNCNWKPPKSPNQAILDQDGPDFAIGVLCLAIRLRYKTKTEVILISPEPQKNLVYEV